MIRSPTIDLDGLSLVHGQVRWLLRHLLQLGEESDASLDAYLKYLRRNGVPFAAHDLPGGSGVNVTYRFEHVMELAIALTLRRQGILKKDTVGVLVQYRDRLTPLYRQAWLKRDQGRGRSVAVKIGKDKSLKVSGLWLDLGLRYLEGGVLTTTGPRLLGPAAAAPPNRDWDFDVDFSNAANLPPISPRFVYLRQEFFVREFEL